jgi:hypothetical protein
LILLADASILIDLEYVGAVELLAMLVPCEVLDLVLMECEHDLQPDLVSKVRACGIVVIEVKQDLVEEVQRQRRGELSFNDMLTVCYARREKRVVLAGDWPMRDRCDREGVEYRGTIWIVEEMHRRRLVTASELCRWLSVWPTVGRRLPSAEIERLRALLGCDAGPKL